VTTALRYLEDMKEKKEKKGHAGTPKREVDEDIVKVTLLRAKRDPYTGRIQYPAEIGHHGEDDERNLNPEE